MSQTYEQLPGRMNIALRRGDQFSALVDFDPTNLTGYTVASHIYSLASHATVSTITTTLASATAGQVTISLTEAQTENLPAGTLGWRMYWDAPGDVRRTVLQGIVEMHR
jgi:hypothetical protein